MNSRRTLNNWLTLTTQWKMTIMPIVQSKLPCNPNKNHILATSNKDTTFTRSSKHKAILTIINVDIGSDIKDKVERSLTVFNIELLSFKRINNFNFELILLIFEIEVFRIEFLFLWFCWQDVVFRFWLFHLLFFLLWFINFELFLTLCI